MVLTLYKLDASPPVRAVLMTIQALDLEVDYVQVNLLEGEHLREDFIRINPQHTVPTLKDDDFVIWDSHAICTYLVDMYAAEDSLIPRDNSKKRAIIDQRLHFDSGILFPALRNTCEPVIFRGEKNFRPENLDKIKSAYAFAEKFLSKDWIAGDDITLADICCVANISSMNEVLPIDENIYSNLAGWLARCSEQDIYKKGNAPGLKEFKELLKSKLA